MLNLDAEQAIDSIQVYEEIDSTNAEALRQIRAGHTDNRLLVASAQTAGKGRRGRAWLSPPNAGIYLSLTRRFTSDANSLQGLSLVTAISVVEALVELGVTGLQLKWPNDVLHDKRKLAGILLELQQKDDALYLVFGVGVNRELPAASIAAIDRPVTDLARLLAEPPAALDLSGALLNSLCKNVRVYEEAGFAEFERRWNALDCYRETDIVIQTGETRIIGRSLGVDAEGALLLQTASGVQAINGGEVFPSLRSLADGTEPT